MVNLFEKKTIIGEIYVNSFKTEEKKRIVGKVYEITLVTEEF